MHTRSLFSGMFLLVAVLTEAAIALSHPRESSLTVLAHGPAGLRIEGKSADVLVEEDASALTFKVPIAPIDTGIGLRDRHLREMLEAEKFPDAILRIPLSELTFPKERQPAEGTAKGDLTLRGQSRPVEVHYRAEPAATSKFLLGLVDPPESLTLGGWVRQGYLWNTVDGKLVDHRELQMRSSLAAAVQLGPLRAAAELGYANSRIGQLAAVTRNQDAYLISREHWIGLAFADGTGLVRGGRINVPFGLRNPEHTSFVRAATRTDINEDQQDGIAIAITKEKWRAEVMAILGNYSLRPDAFRERRMVG